MKNFYKKIAVLIVFISILLLPVCLHALEFAPPLGTTDVRVIIARIIQAVLGVVGSVALLMFIIGGFLWLTAAGNTDRIEKAKNILIWSTLGLVVIFSAYAITQLIITAILEGGT